MKLLFKSVLVIVCLLFPGAFCRAKSLGKFQFKKNSSIELVSIIDRFIRKIDNF